MPAEINTTERVLLDFFDACRVSPTVAGISIAAGIAREELMELNLPAPIPSKENPAH